MLPSSIFIIYQTLESIIRDTTKVCSSAHLLGARRSDKTTVVFASEPNKAEADLSSPLVSALTLGSQASADLQGSSSRLVANRTKSNQNLSKLSSKLLGLGANKSRIAC